LCARIAAKSPHTPPTINLARRPFRRPVRQLASAPARPLSVSQTLAARVSDGSFQTEAPVPLGSEHGVPGGKGVLRTTAGVLHRLRSTRARRSIRRVLAGAGDEWRTSATWRAAHAVRPMQRSRPPSRHSSPPRPTESFAGSRSPAGRPRSRPLTARRIIRTLTGSAASTAPPRSGPARTRPAHAAARADRPGHDLPASATVRCS
jgi:hypothetical protein